MKSIQLQGVNLDLPSSQFLERYCATMETTISKVTRDGLRCVLIGYLSNRTINPDGLSPSDLFPNPVMGRPKKVAPRGGTI